MFAFSLVVVVDRAGPSRFVTGVDALVKTGSSPALTTVVPELSGSVDTVALSLSRSISNRFVFFEDRMGMAFSS